MLDDHRFQPSSLPRPVGAARTRRETLRSRLSKDDMQDMHDVWEIDRSNADRLDIEAITDQRGHPAVVVITGDDERDATAVDHRSVAQLAADVSADGFAVESSRLVRRPTVRRGRASSKASRSTSPPNSVDAFADQGRRDHSNTLESKPGSDLPDLCPQRSRSGGTHRRGPTFGEDQSARPGDAPTVILGSNRDSAEADVCFPPPAEDDATGHTIDFEALDEFIAPDHLGLASAKGRGPVVGPSSARPSPRHSLLDRATGIHRPSSAEVSCEKKEGNDDDDDDYGFAMGPVDPDPCSLERSSSARKAAEVNRFSFFSSKLETTIHAPEMRDLTMPGESFQELFKLDPEGGMWWLDVLDPTVEEFQALAKAFGIHPLTSEDITTQEMREKVELFKQYYFVCFQSFFQLDKANERYMEPVNVYIVVFRKGVLTFTFAPSPHASNVRRRIGRLRDYVSLSSDWVCYALM